MNINFKEWFEEVRQELLLKKPDRTKTFTREEIVKGLWDLKDVDPSTGRLLFDKFYHKIFKE